MASLKRSWLIPFVVLALCLLAREGAAQQAQPVDPWQFPKLANSKPFQRWWWQYEQRAYPLGGIPEHARLRALQQIEQAKAGLPSTSQPVAGGGWTNIGPAPINGGQIGARGNTRPMSGRVADVAVHPSDPNHWLIGAAQGGIWRTLDGGTTWTPLTDAQASLAIGAIAFAPSDPNIIYAGTGEAVFSGDAYAGAGLLKSTDGGTIWLLLATTTFAKATFSDIKVHPTNPNIVLAATSRGIAGRVAVFPPSAPSTGILKSSDGGATWSLKLNGQATDLEVDPTNFNNQYAGIGEIFGSSANGVYRSTDGGEHWTLVPGPWSTMPGGVGRVELAIAPSNPNVLYVSIQDAINGVGDDGGLLGLFRTDNAWATTPTWTRIPTNAIDDGTGVHGYCGWNLAFAFDADQCWYNHEIIVDPTNADTLYAGGIELWKCTSCGASPTWSEVSKTVSSPVNGIHVDQHSMAWAGTRLVVGNDGGVWSTTDGGSTWADHNTMLSITQFYDGSIHPTDPNFALGGSQDNGTGKWTGTNAWQWIFGGDGAASAISSSNPNTHWAVSFQGLGILRTTNGGSTFTVADSGIDKTGVPFIARFEKCPANDDVFIAGTDNIWRSNNFFSGSNPNWSDNLSGNFSSGISALAFAPLDATCNTYAFGTYDGSLRLTFNGGSTWVDIDPGNAVPNRAVTDLAFDPADSNILYVTLSGFDEGTPGAPGHLFKTTNALSGSPTWSNGSPAVNIPHNTIVLDPFDASIVYVGTDLGVWKSTNGGTTWTHMGPETGMPNVAVFDLQINHTTSRLVAFTHGRGAFVLGPAPTTKLANISTRGRVETGDNVMIGGFIIQGTTPKRVLIRGRGPSMGGAPFFVPEVLANPFLRLFSGQTISAENDNWQDTQASEILATGLDPCQPNPGQTSAPPGCTLEAAILITLAPGPYTVHLLGVGGGTGVGLVEVFEVDSASAPKLINISTRGLALTGDNVMIGGFIIQGTTPKRVLIRGRGPSMGGAPFFVPEVLANPFLRLFSGQTISAENDNWQDTQASEILATGLDPCQPNPGQTSAPPGCTLEAAILITLAPGPYTVHLLGVGGGTGVGLVEIFEVSN